MGLFHKHAEDSPPGKIVRSTSRAATGGAAIFIAFLAFMMLRFGTGGSGGDPATVSTGSSGSPPLASSVPPADGTAALTSLVTDPVKGGLTDDEQTALSGTTLTLLIDERSYLMELPFKESPLYRPVELTRAIELARLAKGDTNGIKVRILRRENARVSAEESLKLELSRKGISADAIHMSEHFVP